MKIEDIFEVRKQGREKNNFGVEIELENIQRPVRVAGWKQEHDGSLRDNGREFIFDGAKTLGESEKLLAALHKSFQDNDIRPKASNLTSTHIHIDVRDLTVEQLLSFIACLMVIEPDLMAASGVDRQNNYFALSTSESDHRLRDLMQVHDADSLRRFIHRQRVLDARYCGINFNSIHNHGTVEMRYLCGQADPRNVMPWLVFYNNLKDLAQEDVDFQALFTSISERGTQDVIDLFKPNFPLTQEGVLEGLRNAQDFVFHLETVNITAPDDGNGLDEYYNRM